MLWHWTEDPCHVKSACVLCLSLSAAAPGAGARPAAQAQLPSLHFVGGHSLFCEPHFRNSTNSICNIALRQDTTFDFWFPYSRIILPFLTATITICILYAHSYYLESELGKMHFPEEDEPVLKEWLVKRLADVFVAPPCFASIFHSLSVLLIIQSLLPAPTLTPMSLPITFWPSSPTKITTQAFKRSSTPRSTHS